MPGVTGAMAFTDCYKHMECLGGMRLQSFLTNGHYLPVQRRVPQLVYIYIYSKVIQVIVCPCLFDKPVS